jgi:hypothetical protein
LTMTNNDKPINTITIAKELYWRHISDTVDSIDSKDADLLFISIGREASSRLSPSDSPSAVVVLCDGNNSLRPRQSKLLPFLGRFRQDPTRTGFVVLVCGSLLVEPSSSSSAFFVEPSVHPTTVYYLYKYNIFPRVFSCGGVRCVHSVNHSSS